MDNVGAAGRSFTLNQAAEILAGEPQWVRDRFAPGGRMSGTFMKAYSFLLSAVASGELKARGPDNPDAEEVIVDRELCWDWVIEERHLLAFLEQRRVSFPALGGDRPSLEETGNALPTSPIALSPPTTE